jgi:hypothetical protein
MIVVVGVIVMAPLAVLMCVGRVVDDFGGLFARSIREAHIDLRRTDSAAIYLRHVHGDVGKAEALRQRLQPFGRRSRRDKCPEHHVATDPRNWIDDGKASIRHRLRICGDERVDGSARGARRESAEAYRVTVVFR